MISGLFSQDPKDNPETEIMANLESLYKLDKEKMETFASTLCPAIQPAILGSTEVSDLLLPNF